MLVFGRSSSPVLPRVRAVLDYVWTTVPGEAPMPAPLRLLDPSETETGVLFHRCLDLALGRLSGTQPQGVLRPPVERDFREQPCKQTLTGSGCTWRFRRPSARRASGSPRLRSPLPEDVGTTTSRVGTHCSAGCVSSTVFEAPPTVASAVNATTYGWALPSARPLGQRLRLHRRPLHTFVRHAR